MKNLEMLVCECEKELDAINISYQKVVRLKTNDRTQKRLGRCSSISSDGYEIEISGRLLKNEIADKATKNVIIHELLHTVKGCMNHGEKWKLLANKVNKNYPQYEISRTTPLEFLGLENTESNKQYKYVIECTVCGKKWYRMRSSNATKYPELYHCTCGCSVVCHEI